jgi:hypothetical protein
MLFDQYHANVRDHWSQVKKGTLLLMQVQVPPSAVCTENLSADVMMMERAKERM